MKGCVVNSLLTPLNTTKEEPLDRAVCGTQMRAFVECRSGVSGAPLSHMSLNEKPKWLL